HQSRALSQRELEVGKPRARRARDLRAKGLRQRAGSQRIGPNAPGRETRAMQVEQLIEALYAKRTTIQPKNLSIFTQAANPCAEILARVSLSAERPCFGASPICAKKGRPARR